MKLEPWNKEWLLYWDKNSPTIVFVFLIKKVFLVCVSVCLCLCVRARDIHMPQCASVCLCRVRTTHGLYLSYYLLESENQTQITRLCKSKYLCLLSHSSHWYLNFFSKLILLNKQHQRSLMVWCFVLQNDPLIPYSYCLRFGARCLLSSTGSMWQLKLRSAFCCTPWIPISSEPASFWSSSMSGGMTRLLSLPTTYLPWRNMPFGWTSKR